jgi:hypothetical protein
MVLITSTLAASTFLVVSSTPSIAAPAPFPKIPPPPKAPPADYIQQIIKSLKTTGKITDEQIRWLTVKANGSTKTLAAIVNQLDKGQDRLDVRFIPPANVKVGDKLNLWIDTRDSALNGGRQFIKLGPGVFDGP